MGMTLEIEDVQPWRGTERDRMNKGWKVEEVHGDYTVYSNAADVRVAVEKATRKAHLYTVAPGEDRIEITGSVTLKWEEALEILGQAQKETE
jgi:hypothetical protein